MQKVRRLHDYRSSKRTYWNVIQVGFCEAPVQEEAAQPADLHRESPRAYQDHSTESEQHA